MANLTHGQEHLLCDKCRHLVGLGGFHGRSCRILLGPFLEPLEDTICPLCRFVRASAPDSQRWAFLIVQGAFMRSNSRNWLTCRAYASGNLPTR